MTDPCPSCREPLDYPSGDGCAAITMHYEPDPDLPGNLEAVAHMAAVSGLHIDDLRVMPAAGVADILYEALLEIQHYRGIEE
jgi:LSD1 subclass zinc finger protein